MKYLLVIPAAALLGCDIHLKSEYSTEPASTEENEHPPVEAYITACLEGCKPDALLGIKHYNSAGVHCVCDRNYNSLFSIKPDMQGEDEYDWTNPNPHPGDVIR